MLEGDQDHTMEEELRRFWDRYPMDDRATTLLLACPLHLQRHVIDTFDPKNKQEVDYSRQVTGYIRSLQADEAALGRKRGYEDEDRGLASKRRRMDGSLSGTEVAPVTAEEIGQFCSRYPIDDRARDYLLTSPPAVQQKVLAEFRPKVENEPDYSSLVTSLIKKMRVAVSSAHFPSHPPGLGLPGTSASGPTLKRMYEFKERFPMDERAWDFLLSAAGHVQEVVVNEFKPRRPDDSDFSAAVTAFVKSMSKPGMDGISRAKLDIFREKYPMDDRAFDYLCAAGSDLQIEVLHTFEPKNQTETDYSRQLTGFLTSRSKNQGAHAMEPRRDGAASREARRGHVYENAAATSHHQHESRKGDGKGGGRLRAFRARYPMDDRAFDYLQQAEPHVQEMFLSEFQPKRRGSDEDYSASVTSYLKVVKNKIQSQSGPTMVAESRGFDALLDGFRRRYPMDERAFGYLSQQSPDVQQRVIDEFRPKFEGEADYSSLLTSFVKSCRPR